MDDETCKLKQEILGYRKVLEDIQEELLHWPGLSVLSEGARASIQQVLRAPPRPAWDCPSGHEESYRTLDGSCYACLYGTYEEQEEAEKDL